MLSAAVPLLLYTEISIEDEAIYLHAEGNLSNNGTLSSMTGSRDIIRRIPINQPMQVHSQLSGQENDFMICSRMQLKHVHFSRRFANGRLLPDFGHCSLSILFAVIA